MAKNQEFSLLANNPSALIEVSLLLMNMIHLLSEPLQGCIDRIDLLTVDLCLFRQGSLKHVCRGSLGLGIPTKSFFLNENTYLFI